MQLLEEMKTNGIKPDVITYSAAISGCAKGGQVEWALQLLEMKSTRNVRPSSPPRCSVSAQRDRHARYSN